MGSFSIWWRSTRFKQARPPLESVLDEYSHSTSSSNAKQDEEDCFLTEIDYRGVFSLTGVEENLIPQILLIEGPRTIFPFARRIIADAVRDGGFPPLMLEPVDFVSLYRQHASRRAAEAEGGDKKA